MNAHETPLEYWTPVTAWPAQGTGSPLFTGRDRVGCITMLGIVFLASALAMGIVTALAWVLA